MVKRRAGGSSKAEPFTSDSGLISESPRLLRLRMKKAAKIMAMTRNAAPPTPTPALNPMLSVTSEEDCASDEGLELSTLVDPSVVLLGCVDDEGLLSSESDMTDVWVRVVGLASAELVTVAVNVRSDGVWLTLLPAAPPTWEHSPFAQN